MYILENLKEGRYTYNKRQGSNSLSKLRYLDYRSLVIPVPPMFSFINISSPL